MSKCASVHLCTCAYVSHWTRPQTVSQRRSRLTADCREQLTEGKRSFVPRDARLRRVTVHNGNCRTPASVTTSNTATSDSACCSMPSCILSECFSSSPWKPRVINTRPNIFSCTCGQSQLVRCIQIEEIQIKLTPGAGQKQIDTILGSSHRVPVQEAECQPRRCCVMLRHKGLKRKAQIKLYCSELKYWACICLYLSCCSLSRTQSEGSPACCCLLDGEGSWATSSWRSSHDLTGAKTWPSTTPWAQGTRWASGISNRVTSHAPNEDIPPLWRGAWKNPRPTVPLSSLFRMLKPRLQTVAAASVFMWTRVEKEC